MAYVPELRRSYESHCSVPDCVPTTASSIPNGSASSTAVSAPAAAPKSWETHVPFVRFTSMRSVAPWAASAVEPHVVRYTKPVSAEIERTRAAG